MPYYNYYYRKRYSPYRSWRRWGVTRSQSQGSRRFTVSFPCETTFAVPTTGSNSLVFGVHPFYSSPLPTGAPNLPEYFRGRCNLVTNNVYTTYCSLYDEVKINSCSVTVSILGLPVGTGCRIISSVDRHANIRDVLSTHNINDLRQAPECKNSVYTSLDNAKMYRYIKARDVGEKTGFIDSSNGNCVVPAYTTSTGVAVPAHQIYANSDWFENSYTWAPNIIFAIEMTAARPEGSSLVVGINCRWNVTFRNPKYGSGADAAFDGEGDEDGNSKTFSEMRSAELRDLKRRSQSDEGREVEVLKDDDTLIDGKEEMEDVDEMSKEELIEVLKKLKGESK